MIKSNNKLGCFPTGFISSQVKVFLSRINQFTIIDISASYYLHHVHAPNHRRGNSNNLLQHAFDKACMLNQYYLSTYICQVDLSACTHYIREYPVNVNIGGIPRALSITSIEIPDTGMLLLEWAQLPGDWQQAPAPSSTKAFGTSLLKQNQYLAIRIPSVVIPEEYNYVINPLHPEMRKVRVVEVKDCVYDLRIKIR